MEVTDPIATQTCTPTRPDSTETRFSHYFRQFHTIPVRNTSAKTKKSKMIFCTIPLGRKLGSPGRKVRNQAGKKRISAFFDAGFMLVHVQGLHQAGRTKPGRNQDGNLGKAIPKRGLWARASILTHHGRSSWSSITGLDQEPARRQESVGMLRASTRTEGRNQDETRTEILEGHAKEGAEDAGIDPHPKAQQSR